MKKSLKNFLAGLLAVGLILNNAVFVSAETVSDSITNEANTGAEMEEYGTSEEKTEVREDETGTDAVEAGEEESSTPTLEETVSGNSAVSEDQSDEEQGENESEASNVIAFGNGTNFKWTLFVDGALYIEGEGEMDSNDSDNIQPWEAYTADITSLMIGEGITVLSDYAFYNCSQLKDVTLSDTVTVIGKGTFAGCNSLSEIVIPENVNSIADYAFGDCANLSKVVFYGCCSVISSSAFQNCNNLSTIVVPNEYLEYYQEALSSLNCDIMPVCVTEGTAGNAGLTWNFADGKLTISYNGTLSNDMNYPWSDYLELTQSLILEEGITGFDWYLTSDMENLQQIQIPASCTEIDDVFMAFDFNECLQSFQVENGNTAFSSIDGVLFDAAGKMLLFYPLGKTDETYTVPDSCETIDYLYSNQLKAVTLGSNTKSIIGEVGGQRLEIVNISDSLETISSTAFETDDLAVSESNPNFTYENKVLYNKDKTKLYLMIRTCTVTDYFVPSTVTWIGEAAFFKTGNDLKVNILSPNVSFGGNPFGFSEKTQGTIYVPTFYVQTKIEEALSAVGVTGVTVSVNFDLDDMTNEEQSDGSYLDVSTGIRWKFDNGTLDVYYDGDLRKIDENDYPWCSFGEEGEDYSEQVVNLVLHEGITGVNGDLVQGMENLEQFVLPASCIVFGDDEDYGMFFLFNDKLREIKVAGENTTYSSVDGVLFSKDGLELLFYPKGKTDSSYTVPDTCKNIYSLYSENLLELNLGNNLEGIEGAFAVGGNSVQKLIIPATLKLAAFPMFVTSKDASIEIDEANPYITLEKGVIYNKDKTILNQLLETYVGEEFIIPETVTEIGDDALAYTSTEIKTVTIPESVRKIGEFAFTSMEHIERVNLLSSDVTFGGTPFFISAVSTSTYAAFYVPTFTARTNILAALERAGATDVKVYVDDTLLGGGISFTEQEEDTLAGNACGYIQVTLSKSSMVYTGSAIKPKVTVKYKYRPYDTEGNLGKTKTIKLSPNVDYSVSYRNNVECGQGTVIVTGMGEYEGVIETSFVITPKKANKLTMEPIADLPYEGIDLAETIKEEVIVKDGVLTVSKDDYSVVIEGNTSEPGKVKVSIVPAENGNYYGKASKATAKFNIIDAEGKENADKLVLSVNTKKIYTYNGKAQKPKVTVTLDGKKVSSKNYKLIYKNNVHAGTGTVYAVGKNKLYGKSAEYTFTIVPKSFEKVKISKLSKIQLMKSIDDIQPIVKDGTKVLREGYDYKVTVDSVKDMSLLGYKYKKVKVYVTNLSSDYTEGTISTELSVFPKKLGNNIYTTVYVDDDYYLEGEPSEPFVEVYYGGKTLWEGEDYTITYKNNKKPGKGKVVITGIGNYSGTVTKTFKIMR